MCVPQERDILYINMDHNNQQQYTPGSLPQPIPNPPAVDAQVPQQEVAPQSTSPLQGQPSLGQQVPAASQGDTVDATWVTQVDSLIKQTVGDPRILSQEFAKLKAQYISGRYGREIKQADKKVN